MGISITFAAASVALVVLVDLATGQGPPIYTNYMQAQQDYRPPPPPMHPVAYIQSANYPQGVDLDKAVELGRDGHKLGKESDKEMKKGAEDKAKGDKNRDKYGDEATTPAPGYLSSLSNSMGGAWKSISSFGRSKRVAPEAKQKIDAHSEDHSDIKSGGSSRGAVLDHKGLKDHLEHNEHHEHKGLKEHEEHKEHKGHQDHPDHKEVDNYEHLQQKNQGYVYFKVPKYLVCNY